MQRIPSFCVCPAAHVFNRCKSGIRPVVGRCVRYADDIGLLSKSRRASKRLQESSIRYLEEKLKLTVNREKTSKFTRSHGRSSGRS